jgi:hypothetical protein
MPRRERERFGWGHVAASALGLVAANLLLRLGLRRRGAEPAAHVAGPARLDDEDEAPRVVDHTPVEPERRDMRGGPAVMFVAALMLFFGLATAAVTGIEWLWTRTPPNLRPPAAGVDDAPGGWPPPEPRLDALPQDTLASVRATEAALMDYGWADEAAGVARLPIERAMELVAERGLPVALGAENWHYRDVVPVLPSDASSGREGERAWP